jgi:acyl-[acyl-carrier-protein]-phospholipid O-acyltransferase / long-chain-fatty-acid--[acyl-carrier-protein] ligase
MTLGRAFIEAAKRRPSAFCMADSTGQELTFARALTAALLLSSAIRRTTAGQQCVGLLLPASVGGALANVATSLAGKVPVNLNFTAGHDAMGAAIERCGIQTILTARGFLAKAGIEAMDGMVFVEDFLKAIPLTTKVRTALAVKTLPASLLVRSYAADSDADDLATIIFSSGSTGIPKGVMLTHRNILSNIDSAMQVFRLTDVDVMIGVLPFFHAFGFTATLWLPLVNGFGVAYHPNPVDAKTIGDLTAKYRGTIIISTPTFYAAYVRKIQPEQFAHLRYAIVGAEKLRPPITAAFKDRFGLDLIEGYGCTEMAPVVAVNMPEPRPGSVGRPIPGVSARVVDPVTGEGPLVGEEGMLLVSGPNRMRGYLDDPGLTASVFHREWYATGDIATIDADGYVRITDRVSRFSKIAGEMVPHMKVEEEIQALLDEGHTATVVSVADESRGERLIAFYSDPALTPAELWEKLTATSLPRLWIPKREDLRQIEAIPTLGSGKVDIRTLKQIASRTENADLKQARNHEDTKPD